VADERTKRMATVAMAGFIAMKYVSDPEIWPGFAAWAEQNQPGETWGEADRQCMLADSFVMSALADACEEASK
jgi:hypothetical protein